MNRGYHHTRSFKLYTSPFLDTDELKMALRARKVSGAFEKRAPDPMHLGQMSCVTLYRNLVACDSCKEKSLSKIGRYSS